MTRTATFTDVNVPTKKLERTVGLSLRGWRHQFVLEYTRQNLAPNRQWQRQTKYQKSIDRRSLPVFRADLRHSRDGIHSTTRCRHFRYPSYDRGAILHRLDEVVEHQDRATQEYRTCDKNEVRNTASCLP